MKVRSRFPNFHASCPPANKYSTLVANYHQLPPSSKSIHPDKFLVKDQGYYMYIRSKISQPQPPSRIKTSDRIHFLSLGTVTDKRHLHTLRSARRAILIHLQIRAHRLTFNFTHHHIPPSCASYVSCYIPDSSINSATCVSNSFAHPCNN